MEGTAQFLESTRTSHDQRIRTTAHEQARSILDMMAFEIRMAGSGVPFGQANFQIGDPQLNDAPLPVLTSSDTDTISFRCNESGELAFLDTELEVKPGALHLSVTDLSLFEEGDTIYISDLPRAGEGCATLPTSQ